MPADDLTRLPHGGDAVIVVFDRPASPGNIGSLARSVDALTGGGALVTTGHSTDAWDPAGMSAASRNPCDEIASIPMIGNASSLNAAFAGAVVLYETLRQRNP